MCLSNNINTPSAMMNSNSMPKPPRPYTEYNLFFQLEREHILQVQLGFEPNYEPHEVFDPSDATNYQGPPLPSRYRDLIYLNDWHLSGKEKRRKRRHRKTHGRISFQELSLKIAEAWKTVDSETRVFCAELCEIGRMHYKVAIKAYKENQNLEATTVQSEANTLSGNEVHRAMITCDSDQVQPVPALPAVDDYSLSFMPTDCCSLDEVDAAFENDVALPFQFNDEAAVETTPEATLIEESSVDSMVDIEDDAIIDMYKSTPGDSKAEEVVPCLNLSTAAFPNVYGTNYQNDSSNTNIEVTVDELKNMSKMLLHQQIQIQSNIIASMQAAMTGSNDLQRKKPEDQDPKCIVRRVTL